MGYITIIRNFYSPPEQVERTLRIFTPEGYDQQPERQFPVLYVFDGQNIFAHPESARYDTWCINSTLDNLAAEGSIRPWIIVGIDHLPDRIVEYSPWTGGRGEITADFLVNHLKPYIDKTYRTLPEAPWTGVMGVSMGGLLSLFIGKKYPHIFGRIGGISPALMWGDHAIFRYWDSHTQQWSKIRLQVGDQEQFMLYGNWLDFVPDTTNFYNHLKSLGYNDYELSFALYEDDAHHETAWQKQMPDTLRWLLEDIERG